MARTVLFRGAATVHALGVSSDTANVVALTIENGAGSGVNVEVQALRMSPSYPNQPMANPAEVRTATAMPTGGTVLDKNRILGSGSSDAAVVVRGARTAADAASAITATGTQARVGFVAHSKHIQSGNQQGILSNQCVLTLTQPIILKPGEALVVTQLPDWITGLATNNHRTHYEVVWEEFTESTSTPVSGSDSGTGTETGTVSATVPGSDSSSGTDAGTVAATVAGSDSATGTDGQVSIVSPVSGADTSTGTDTGTVSATVPGSEAATGTDAGTATVTGSGSDTGAGSEGAGVSATVTGSDSAVGTDAGTVVDVTGGPTLVTDSDSGAGSETGLVVDLTPPAPPPDVGGGGGRYEPGGDETSIYGDFVVRADSDSGRGYEAGAVVDLTPRPVRLPTPAPEVPEPEPVPVVRLLSGGDAGTGDDKAVGLDVAVEGRERAVVTETALVEPFVPITLLRAAEARAREAEEDLAVVLLTLP